MYVQYTPKILPTPHPDIHTINIHLIYSKSLQVSHSYAFDIEIGKNWQRNIHLFLQMYPQFFMQA